MENSRQESACMLPNVARYQLRHTPMCEKIFDFRSISVSGQICGQPTFLFWFWRRQHAKKSMFTRVFEPLENLRSKTTCMLPNVARYRFGEVETFAHTPRFFVLIYYTTKLCGCLHYFVKLLDFFFAADCLLGFLLLRGGFYAIINYRFCFQAGESYGQTGCN